MKVFESGNLRMKGFWQLGSQPLPLQVRSTASEPDRVSLWFHQQLCFRPKQKSRSFCFSLLALNFLVRKVTREAPLPFSRRNSENKGLSVCGHWRSDSGKHWWESGAGKDTGKGWLTQQILQWATGGLCCWGCRGKCAYYRTLPLQGQGPPVL